MSPAPRPRPVLYLDVDDTLVRYPDRERAQPVEAAGASEFLGWAVERYDVRWLTQWCRAGRMGDAQIDVLCRLLDVEPGLLRDIRGLDWRGSESKLDGIAWLEHVVLERPFVWVEDDYGLGDTERRFLARHGFAGCWRPCNVTEDAGALRALHRVLRREKHTSVRRAPRLTRRRRR